MLIISKPTYLKQDLPNLNQTYIQQVDAKIAGCLRHLAKSLPLAQALLVDISDIPISFLKKKTMFINLSKMLTFYHSPPSVVKLQDPFSKIKEVFLNPERTLDLSQKGSITPFQKLFPMSALQDISQVFFEFIHDFYKAYLQSSSLAILKLPSCHFIFHKTNHHEDFYALIPFRLYKGGFKEVYLAAKIARKIELFAFSKSLDVNSYKQEISFRAHPVLSPLFPKNVLNWMGKDIITNQVSCYMLTPWANQGTLQEFLQKPLSLKQRDNLALQLLFKMTVLHAHGVHKDVKIDNFLVHEHQGDYHLFINDIGCGFLNENPQFVGTIFSKSHHLSPEVIKYLMRKKVKLDTDIAIQTKLLSTEDWIYIERFQIGHILARLYLGHSPLTLIQDRASVLKNFPLSQYSFDELLEEPEMLYKLEAFMSDEEKDDLEESYKQPFQEFYDRLAYFPGAPYKKSPGAEEDDADEDSEAVAEQYDQIFESYFRSHSQRSLLEDFFAPNELKATEEIYAEAYKRMQQAKTTNLNVHLAKTIAHLEHEIKEFFPNYESLLNGRLIPVFKLMSLNPLQRPSFEEVFDDLLDSIHSDF